MRRGDRPTSGWRSAPLMIFGVALLILLGGVAVIVQNESTYGRARVDQTQGLSDVLAASVAAAVDFDDPAAAQQAVDAFSINKQIRFISIYKRDGHAIAGYDRSGRPVAPTIAALRDPAGNVIRVHSSVVQAGQNIGTVYVDIDREAPARRLSRYLVLTGLFVLAALVVAALGLAQAQLRRANRDLAERAEALAQSNEMLGEQMEERAKAEEELRQSHKMQALGQLTGGIAHDFNNLLTVIQGSADMLCRANLPAPKRQRFAQAIVQAAENAAALTSQLLSFARRQPLTPERLNINDVLREISDLIDRTMGERINAQFDLAGSSCVVEGEKAQLQSAILNIASNARNAMPAGGRLSIRTRDVRDRPARMIAVELQASGLGMDPAKLERMFEPFFTTKGTGQGTGLGLSQVYGFASQSGGEVRATSEIGKGTTITLLLPCSNRPQQEAEIAAESGPAGEQKAIRILVVEDNEQVATFAQNLLSELGHEVT